MKNNEIRKTSAPDLEKKLSELQKELVKFHTQAAMGTQLKSPGQIRQIKRNIARIKTEQNNKVRTNKHE